MVDTGLPAVYQLSTSCPAIKEVEEDRKSDRHVDGWIG